MIRYIVWSSGARGIVIGLSGGVDSAVAAAMCCRAISRENVLGLTLPTKVTMKMISGMHRPFRPFSDQA